MGSGRRLSSWWRHHMETFSALLAFVRGIHRSPVNSPHKGQWRGALMFSLICVWINDWVINNREAGDLRRYRAHYDIIVMLISSCIICFCGQVWIFPNLCVSHYYLQTLQEMLYMAGKCWLCCVVSLCCFSNGCTIWRYRTDLHDPYFEIGPKIMTNPSP